MTYPYYDWDAWSDAAASAGAASDAMMAAQAAKELQSAYPELQIGATKTKELLGNVGVETVLDIAQGRTAEAASTIIQQGIDQVGSVFERALFSQPETRLIRDYDIPDLGAWDKIRKYAKYTPLGQLLFRTLDALAETPPVKIAYQVWKARTGQEVPLSDWLPSYVPLLPSALRDIERIPKLGELSNDAGEVLAVINTWLPLIQLVAGGIALGPAGWMAMASVGTMVSNMQLKGNVGDIEQQLITIAKSLKTSLSNQGINPNTVPKDVDDSPDDPEDTKGDGTGTQGSTTSTTEGENSEDTTTTPLDQESSPVTIDDTTKQYIDSILEQNANMARSMNELMAQFAALQQANVSLSNMLKSFGLGAATGLGTAAVREVISPNVTNVTVSGGGGGSSARPRMGKTCPMGQVWDDKLQRCVAIANSMSGVKGFAPLMQNTTKRSKGERR